MRDSLCLCGVEIFDGLRVILWSLDIRVTEVYVPTSVEVDLAVSFTFGLELVIAESVSE
jgi:hypothetical protein